MPLYDLTNKVALVTGIGSLVTVANPISALTTFLETIEAPR